MRARRGEGEPRAQLEAALAQLGRAAARVASYVPARGARGGGMAGGRSRRRASYARAGLAAPFAAQLVAFHRGRALWAARCGDPAAPSPNAPPLPEPVRLELAGDWRGAIRAWRGGRCPIRGCARRSARQRPGGAGGRGGANKARRAPRQPGASPVSVRRAGAASLRGPRRSTLANEAGSHPARAGGVAVLATGATNAQIAAALHLSERTVAHHVSRSSASSRAPTRTAAVECAARRIARRQHGPVNRPT